MKILCACEESQTVCKAFRMLGHDAYSCDILECSGGYPQYHIKCDVRIILKDGWDMMLAFPPCTNLASSGARYFQKKREDGSMKEAIDFFMDLVNSGIPRIAIENPVGVMSSFYRKPDQILQPWMFGHPESKATCLWLINLPPLKPTNVLDPIKYRCNKCHSIFDGDLGKYGCICGEGVGKPLWSNQTPSGQNKLGPSPQRARIRAKTYDGLGKAMAVQWGGEVGCPLKLRFPPD